MTIDYARAQREFPRLKAALTRAKNSGSPVKVLEAVEKAYDAFDQWGAWPDDWALWRVALLDARWDWEKSDAYWDGDDEALAVNDRFIAAVER